MKKKLVISSIQAIILCALLVSGPLIVPVILSLLIQLLGVLLLLWSLLAIKQSKKQRLYSLPKYYYLVTTGPYEIIRHPILAGIFFIVFPLIQAVPSPFRIVLFILLVISFLFQIMFDESVMRKSMKEYGSYQSKTKRIIPYLY